MHMQGETSQPQQYGDAYAQQGHSVDVHEDRTQDGRYQHVERRN
jgi:hypothetical protein